MVLQSNKKPEEAAREDIDKMLELSGWKIKAGKLRIINF
jgi:hypothetical protein